MSEKICVIILNWNGKEDTLKCLDSLRGPDVEIIVVDNGSTDDSVQMIREKFPKVTLIEVGCNLGYAGGNNVGIEYGLKRTFDHFFILNNDTIVDPQCIQAFLEGFAKDPEAGILGAKILRMDEPDLIDHLGGNWNPKRQAFDYVGYREKDDGKFEEMEALDYVCGAAIMVKRAVFEKIGVFDPRFFLFWEEADFCFRAREAGFSVKTCPKAKIWHRISASFTGGKPHAAYFVTRNRLLWIEKNFRGAKRPLMLTKLIGKDLTACYVSKAIRSMQKTLQKIRGKDFTRNADRIVRANSVLTANWDYLFRRFYSGRSKNFMNCH